MFVRCIGCEPEPLTAAQYCECCGSRISLHETMAQETVPVTGPDHRTTDDGLGFDADAAAVEESLWSQLMNLRAAGDGLFQVAHPADVAVLPPAVPDVTMAPVRQAARSHSGAVRRRARASEARAEVLRAEAVRTEALRTEALRTRRLEQCREDASRPVPEHQDRICERAKGTKATGGRQASERARSVGEPRARTRAGDGRSGRHGDRCRRLLAPNP